MKRAKYRYFVGDFETTVYGGQKSTEVWASASVEMFSEDVQIFHSIDEQFEYFKSLNCNIICYYHNLKFDGMFYLSYLLYKLKFTHAGKCENPEDFNTFRWFKNKDMKNNSVKYLISNMGQWYSITIKVADKIIELRDSLKLLPFPVKRIGESFKTKHKKSSIEYTGFRYAGCEITDEEKEYIANDVLVVKEALEIMFTEGHNRLTIGSCCLAEYKSIIGNKAFIEYFPNLYEMPLDVDTYGVPNIGEYVRKSYRGGWCYLVKGKERKRFTGGVTVDVNSLYPSMMSSESGNLYPVGKPIFWCGDYIPDEARKPDKYYFVRLKTRFYLKPGKLPFVQIKNTLMYKANEMLCSSDIYDIEGNVYKEIIDFDGQVKSTAVTLTMTQTDYILFKEHYELVDFEILDGCYFNAVIGIFDEYIEKYKQQKLNSTGALRELAKLFLNNLYGKMASSTNSSFKVAYIKDDKSIGFYPVISNDKEAGYIPCGTAITSYARNFTIRAAQLNYYGVDMPGFIYADTDSLHIDLPAELIQGVKLHDKNFCCWKIEAGWDIGYYVRQKTYLEHVVTENGVKVDSPYYLIKCAGMPDRCKQLLLCSMGEKEINVDETTDEEKAFLSTVRNVEDFDIGLTVPSKLLPKSIKGGVVLTSTTYKMR